MAFEGRRGGELSITATGWATGHRYSFEIGEAQPTDSVGGGSRSLSRSLRCCHVSR